MVEEEGEERKQLNAEVDQSSKEHDQNQWYSPSSKRKRKERKKVVDKKTKQRFAIWKVHLEALLIK